MLLNKRIPVMFLFKKVKHDFAFITIYTAIVGLLDFEMFQIKHIDMVTIPLAIPGILGTAISLLLAFRTNHAYDRWWEARIIWGAIVNKSRTLVRQIKYFYSGADKDFIRNFSKRQIAWCYCYGQRLRQDDEKRYLEKYLGETATNDLIHYTNIPNALLCMHSNDIKHAYENKDLNEFQQIQLDSTVSELCDCMGMGERIKTTVFPKTYSMLLHLLIYVFAFILPFSLTNYPVSVLISLNVIISSIFLLIERTAIHIEDPFEGRATDTAVTSIARTIEINILKMIGEKEVPGPLEPEGYYLM